MNPSNEIQEPSLRTAQLDDLPSSESAPERGHSRPQQKQNARRFRAISMPGKTPTIANLFFVFVALMSLTSCSFLKPTPSTERHFVLTPLPPMEGATNAPVSTSVALGVAQVKVAPYLFNKSLAVRQGTNEIRYLQSVLWAEYLDSAIQSVLAANLASSLHTQRIRLSSWRSEEVSVEVYVRIEQLDVNTIGEGVLAAWWRIVSPGGEKTLKSGKSHLVRQGPQPEREPAGAVATLSGLVGEFSSQLAETIAEALPSGASPSIGTTSNP